MAKGALMPAQVTITQSPAASRQPSPPRKPKISDTSQSRLNIYAVGCTVPCVPRARAPPLSSRSDEVPGLDRVAQVALAAGVGHPAHGCCRRPLVMLRAGAYSSPGRAPPSATASGQRQEVVAAVQ